MDTFRAILIDTRTESVAVSIGCGADTIGDAEAYFNASAPDGWKIAALEQVKR